MTVPGLARSYARALLLPRTGRGPLPTRVVTGAPAAAEPASLARYAEVCAFARTDPLPPTHPHTAAFPLALDLMTRRDFPFRPTGLIHLGVRVEQRRPLAADEPLRHRVEAGGLAPHPRGTAFEIRTTALDATGAAVWHSTSTYLRRDGRRRPGARRAPDAPRDGPREVPPEVPPEVQGPGEPWDVPADTGRRYAAASGDRNPIHLHPLTARLFGLPGPIAHGMWSLARCLAAQQDALPGAFTVEAAFSAPVPLPARVTLHATTPGPFTLRSATGDRVHLTGRTRALGQGPQGA
ncbi:MaoC family dehydratase [Streptomyces radicis]|uniref:MaoC-like domain-containing protein n=1 Tax=Streptomyces radicis TaxID=1750517 RepID=A0A3A9VTG4_9ACTN|nr:MaoC/PaaZ C-terminal domain-containing protein [Streptomyces radicis]RKN03832.1 hypothetical protein D7319_30375 [Streptomyces radicis]RKN13929.1 hypothetical protein D7318_30230 [Streptomyces radicis]